MNLPARSVAISLLSFFVVIFLTSRYLPVETDALNSPIVWREINEHGLWVLRYWYATADNWFFTVYPVNFFFYIIFGNDGIVPLTISTALFASVTAISFWYAAYLAGANKYSLLVVCALSLMPAYAYTYGFISHPFSHYSTTAYGAVAVALMMANVALRNYALVIFVSVISILAGASDPWYLAAFFLPILLTSAFLLLRKQATVRDVTTYAIAFAFSFSGVIQRIFNIPVEHFSLTNFEQMILNAEDAFTAIGRLMNPFFVNNNITLILSLVVWIPLTLYSLLVCFRHNNESSYIAVLSSLSISAIISSFILSFEHTNDMNARFFGNIPAFAITICVICAAVRKSKFIAAFIILFCASSVYSYTQEKGPMFDQGAKTAEMIKFLIKNDLSFGYSNTVQYATTTNWMSNGDIKIIPVYQNPKTGYIAKDVARGQTMRYWLSDESMKKAPERQFFAVAKSARSCSDKKMCIDAITKRIGQPDKTLTFHQFTILVYNHRLSF